MIYPTRKVAGWHLARRLKSFESDPNKIVAGLARGGLVTAKEVADYLRVPMAVILVAKIGHPSNPEFALGAATYGEKVLFEKTYLDQVDSEWLDEAENSARRLLEYRRSKYHLEDQDALLNGKTVILVDDGMATGLSMQAAVLWCRGKGASRVIVAVPVASREAYARVDKVADNVILLDSPDDFLGSVGAHYIQFEQVDDEQVIHLIGGLSHV